jgi:hypothetical protein
LTALARRQAEALKRLDRSMRPATRFRLNQPKAKTGDGWHDLPNPPDRWRGGTFILDCIAIREKSSFPGKVEVAKLERSSPEQGRSMMRMTIGEVAASV